MDIDEIKGIPIDKITKIRTFKYSGLVDYAKERIDDGMVYPLDKILGRHMPNWIEGYEEGLPTDVGFYLKLGKKLRSFLRIHKIHVSVFRSEEYEYGCGYVAVFYSKSFTERNKLKALDQNKEVPGAVGKLTKEQLKELDSE